MDSRPLTPAVPDRRASSLAGTFCLLAALSSAGLAAGLVWRFDGSGALARRESSWPYVVAGGLALLAGVSLHRLCTGNLRARERDLLRLADERTGEIEAEIAERRRSEAALREERAILDAVLEHIPDHVYFKDRESRFLRINEAMVRWFRLADSKEALGKTDAYFFGPEHARTALEDEAEIMRTGASLAGKEEKETWPDGRVTWVHTTKTPLRDHEGRVIGTMGISRDITARKLAEEELARHQQRLEEEIAARTADLRTANTQLRREITEREQTEKALRRAEEKYRAIFENAVEGIYQTTPDGRFLAANPAMARMLGYNSPEELMAEASSVGSQHYVEPERRGDFQRLIEQLGTIRGFEHEMRRRDGSRIWVSASGRVVRDDAGAVRYYEGRLEDITERKRAESLLDSLRRSETMSALGMLVAGVAHEVRNPLFAISANLDALEARGGVAPELERSVGMMRSEVERLAVLMRDLLDYGRPKEAVPQPGAVGTVVADAAAACAGLARTAAVSIVNEVPSDLPDVLMDRKRLVQVLQNLLQNAIQHSRSGGVVTLAGLRQASERGPVVVLTVSDSGPGFEPEDLTRVFEPFFSRRRGGTGLGLAIVQRIIDQHGGAVAASNRPGGGATISVSLPALVAGAPPAG